ncbi:MAG: DUF2807 domain-containing protein [Clostridium sp.]|nr:DUF2807 domain-containing protein [Clostridium sp.]
MKIKSTILAILFAFSALMAMQAKTITPSSRYVTQKVSVGNFTSIRVNTFVDVEYTVGSRSVEVYAPDNMIDYIEAKVEGGELRIGYKENMNIQGKHNSCVRVSAPAVNNFTTASAGDITIKSPINIKNAEVNLKVLSAGDIKAKSIEAATVRLTTNSAGDIETGSIKADDVALTANSAGDIETGAIAAKNKAEIKSNSAGEIEAPEVVAGNSVEIFANSAGDIEIGAVNTTSTSIATNSAGDIEIKSLKAKNVSASASSAGEVTLAGNCDSANLSSASIGAIEAGKLKANHVTAKVSSNGSVYCHPLQSLNAMRRGLGKIKWHGNPSDVTIDDPKGNGVSKI